MKFQWWSSLKRQFNGLYLAAFAFITCGIILFLLPLPKDNGWLQVLAGALLGTGLTIVVTTMTTSQSIREQYKKEANLQRKTNVYGPLHTELKNLREIFDEAHTGEKPYPIWIKVNDGRNSPSVFRIGYTPPELSIWLEFRKNYHIDDFTPAAQKILNDVQNLAEAYNKAIEDVLKSMKAVLGPHIATSIEQEEQRQDYKEWQRRRKETSYVYVASPWFEFIERSVQISISTNIPLGEDLALSWSRTIGWLLTNRPDKAAQQIYNSDVRNMNAINFVSPSWFEDIFQATLIELKNEPTYQYANDAQENLSRRLKEAENILYHGLLDIRNQYEGGIPPV